MRLQQSVLHKLQKMQHLRYDIIRQRQGKRVADKGTGGIFIRLDLQNLGKEAQRDLVHLRRFLCGGGAHELCIVLGRGFGSPRRKLCPRAVHQHEERDFRQPHVYLRFSQIKPYGLSFRGKSAVFRSLLAGRRCAAASCFRTFSV